MTSQTLDYTALLSGLGGGLALFLHDMRKMTASLKSAAGGSMKRLLGRLTTDRFTAAMSGALVTAVIQSSSVNTVTVVGFVTAGLLSFSQSIGVIMGANIGTMIIAQIIAFEATDYALVLIAGGFPVELLPFADLVRDLSPAFPDLTGVERLAAEVPRQVANAHAVFNVVVTLVFIGFTTSLARPASQLLPEPKKALEGPGVPGYLQPMFLDQPALALDRVRSEISRLADLATEVVDRALAAALAGRGETLGRLQQADQYVDDLHGEIVSYSGKLSLQELVEREPEQIQSALTVTNYLENIADVVETAFIAIGRRRIESELAVPDNLALLLKNLHADAARTGRLAADAYLLQEVEMAGAALEAKDSFKRRADQIRVFLGRRLASGQAETLRVYRMGLDLLEAILRVYTLARRIVRHVQESETAAQVPAGRTAANEHEPPDEAA
jgi:phosphate:Na+ symporter